MRYLPVSVFSSGSDCSNNGVSATHPDQLVVEHERGFLSLEEVRNRGYIILHTEPSRVPGAPDHFVPEGLEGKWTMFGGTYISTSDSRFTKKYGWSPLALHDRVEG